MSNARVSQLVECSICIEAFSLDEHLPKCLPCGHTFCLSCLKNVTTRGSISCPNCKKTHSVPTEGAKGFITNHIITSVLDQSCGKCHGLVETSQCPHCPAHLCPRCLETHIQTEYKPAVDAALERLLSILQQLHTQLPVFVEKLNKMFGECDQFCQESRKDLKQLTSTDSLKQIEEKSSGYMKILTELDDLLSISIDMDIPRLTHTKRPASRFLSRASVLQNKNARLPRKKPVTYNSIPSLVFGASGSGSRELKGPLAATVDEFSGDIYIGDGQNNRICVYDKDAGYKSAFDVGSYPWDLCYIPDGYIIVTCGDHKIRIYDVSGKVKQTIGSKGKDLGEFDNPCGITTDMEGLLYVCDRNNHRVQVLDENGSVVRVLGISEPGKLEEPCSVAVHPQTGQVYVVDSRKKQLKIYRHDGQFETCLEEDDIPGVYAQYVSFGSNGLLCVSDPDNYCIHLVRDGSVTQRIGERGSAPGQFECPLGSTVTNSGDIIVCDMSNNKVYVYSPN